MTHLLIIGAGYTGLKLARRALDKGWDVAGTTRSAETASELEEMGAEAILFDAAEDGASALAHEIRPGTKIVYSVPTMFRSVPANEAHLDFPHGVLEIAEEARASQLVYLSSTSVYGDHGGDEVDEESERKPDSPFGVMRRDIEDLVQGWDGELRGNVVRIAGIYGPGRTLVDHVERGRYQVVNRDKVTNRIHIDDLVSVILAVLEAAPESGRAFVAADGNPVRVGDLVDFLVDRGMQEPRETTLEAYREERGPNAAARWRTTTRCKNDRARDELGVEFQHPDVFSYYRRVM